MVEEDLIVRFVEEKEFLISGLVWLHSLAFGNKIFARNLVLSSSDKESFTLTIVSSFSAVNVSGLGSCL